MRRTVISLFAVGVLVFAGCSDSDNDPSSDAGSSDSGSSDDGGGGDAQGAAADSEFCTTFEDLISGGTDIEDSEVLERIQSVEPPEEIADEYATFVEFVEINTNI